MSQFPLVQFPLGRRSPLPGGEARGKVVFTIALEVIDGTITLELQDQDGNDYIAINEDSVVEVVLDGKQLFFSKAHDGITMKGPDLEHYYGQLSYGGYIKELDRYKSVSFHARFNHGGKLDTTHGFNVNVDLLRPGDCPEFIGLSIDPDIKNPPPNKS
jgi:hypothetical protein